MCGESGGGGGEVFGWAEGGGEEGGVDVACCAGGGVCMEGRFRFFSFLSSLMVEWIFFSEHGCCDLLCFCFATFWVSRR